MRDYFLRRILLIPPTLIGVTMIVFAITRFVPGGPFERMLMTAQMAAEDGGGGGASRGAALSEEQIENMKAYFGLDKPWYVAYVGWLGKVVQGDLGTSNIYNDSVWSMIKERLPVSFFYGGLTLFITYAVCVPLGVVKAIKHMSFMDNATSIVIFSGYAVPGYVLGSLLVVYPAARWEWFPMSDFYSYDFEYMSFWEKVVDLFHHAALPLSCYLVGSFAFVTLLMKNHLLENLAADYVRTAVAKGVSFKGAVFRHALRNSLIPIATNFGQSFTIFVSGSFLIESIFDIDGLGLLGYTSTLERDYPIVMGVLLISSIFMLVGNLIGDALVALADPRVRFK